MTALRLFLALHVFIYGLALIHTPSIKGWLRWLDLVLLAWATYLLLHA